MLGRSLKLSLLFVAALAMAPAMSYGQGVGGGGGVGGGAGGGGAGQQDGQPSTGGVEINAEGVLRTLGNFDQTGQLTRQRWAEAEQNLNKDINKVSELRKISLTRLEREVRKLIDAGEPVPADMQYLAGLTRITHVFFYPETDDIVIAGPAEGWFINGQNRVVGTKTGQATCQLQDLVVALRAFSPDGKQAKLISCSIDPTQEGLQRFAATYRQVAANFTHASQAQAAAEAFYNALGLQEITINGVSPKTHFAQVMVEADYRMKLIGIGVEVPQRPVRITSFIEKASPTTVAKSSLQRWFFQPNYECLTISEDENAMELTGSAVKLVGEDESVAANGNRAGTGRMNGASKAFTRSFTQQYDTLAAQSTVFGELRNVIDMSIAAAFIQKMDLYGKAGWKMETFGDESIAPVEVFKAPTKVEPVLNAVWKGRYFMTPIGGGVNIQPRIALNSDKIKHDSDGSIAKVNNAITLDGLADGQWWWD